MKRVSESESLDKEVEERGVRMRELILIPIKDKLFELLPIDRFEYYKLSNCCCCVFLLGLLFCLINCLSDTAKDHNCLTIVRSALNDWALQSALLARKGSALGSGRSSTWPLDPSTTRVLVLIFNLIF